MNAPKTTQYLSQRAGSEIFAAFGVQTNLPLVSIIISSYNYERFLRGTIESALNQTYHNIEVICVDDGSSDGSIDIINSYLRSVLAVVKEHGGQGSSLNAGYQKSSGEIIIFLDSDDYLYPNCVEEVVAEWRPGLSSLHYRMEFVDETGISGVLPDPRLLKTDAPFGDLREKLFRDGGFPHFPTSANAFSRQFLSFVLPLPEGAWRTDPDVYLCYLAALYGEIGFIDSCLCAFRLHQSAGSTFIGGQLSLRRLARKISLRIEAQASIRAHAASLGYDIDLRDVREDPNFLKEYFVLKRLSPLEQIVTSEMIISWTIHEAFRKMMLGLLRARSMSIRKRLLYLIWTLLVYASPRKIVEFVAKKTIA